MCKQRVRTQVSPYIGEYINYRVSVCLCEMYFMCVILLSLSV